MKGIALKKTNAKRDRRQPKTLAEVNRARAYDATGRHGRLTLNTPTALIEIVDPHAAEPGDKIITYRSLRSDPIAAIHAQDGVNDIQYDAARRMQGLYERSQIGSIQAMDCAKPKVDGGMFSDGNTDSRLKAQATLDRINAALNRRDAAWLFDILMLGLTLHDACAKRGRFAQDGTVDKEFLRYAGKHLGECLNEVAVELGLMTAPQVPVIPYEPGEQPRKARKHAISGERQHPFHP